MPLDFDPAADFAIFDGQGVVSYTSTSGESSDAAAITGLEAVHRDVSHLAAQQLAGLGVSGVERVFHIPASGLSAISPKEGDKITDADGGLWRVLRAGLQTLETRWRFDCRRLGG